MNAWATFLESQTGAEQQECQHSDGGAQPHPTICPIASSPFSCSMRSNHMAQIASRAGLMHESQRPRETMVAISFEFFAYLTRLSRQWAESGVPG